MKRALDTVLLLLAGLAIWEAMHLAAPFALTSPAGTAARTWQMLTSATFWPHAAETARAFVSFYHFLVCFLTFCPNPLSNAR